MLAMKLNFQNLQIQYVCKNMWPRTKRYHLSSPFSIYPMITHFIAQKIPYCNIPPCTPWTYHCTTYTRNEYLFWEFFNILKLVIRKL
jgi:hypothetical protein